MISQIGSVSNGNYFKKLQLHIGAMQGSILGAFLCIIFINDFPSCPQHGKSILYADDINIY